MDIFLNRYLIGEPKESIKLDPILIVDDEEKIRSLVRLYLEREGFVVEEAEDGRVALNKFHSGQFSLLIVDLMMPDIDGWRVCREVRESSALPIIMLTARGEEFDRVLGLELGADDYLVKPFHFDELLARVKALLRRRNMEPEQEVLKYSDLELNTVTREAFRGTRPIELTAKEYDLLEYFLRHPRQVLTREQIYDRVWGYDFGGESNIIEVYVRYLRSKLEADNEARLIQTVRGVGYVFAKQQD